MQPAAARQLQNIRLGSAAANPLSRSRNQRADEDGCLSFNLDACRSGFPVSARLPKTGGSRLKGMTVRTIGSELSDRAVKPLHPSDSASDGSPRSRFWPLQRVPRSIVPPFHPPGSNSDLHPPHGQALGTTIEE
jgi:hypothetical protein